MPSRSSSAVPGPLYQRSVVLPLVDYLHHEHRLSLARDFRLRRPYLGQQAKQPQLLVRLAGSRRPVTGPDDGPMLPDLAIPPETAT